MTEWPEYRSHKIVRAAKIVNQELDKAGNIIALEVDPGDGAKEWFKATEPAMTARGELGGYAVIYDDGYKSVSPAKIFEDGYTKV
jgi:hypothetical protein